MHWGLPISDEPNTPFHEGADIEVVGLFGKS